MKSMCAEALIRTLWLLDVFILIELTCASTHKHQAIYSSIPKGSVVLRDLNCDDKAVSQSVLGSNGSQVQYFTLQRQGDKANYCHLVTIESLNSVVSRTVQLVFASGNILHIHVLPGRNAPNQKIHVLNFRVQPDIPVIIGHNSTSTNVEEEDSTNLRKSDWLTCLDAPSFVANQKASGYHVQLCHKGLLMPHGICPFRLRNHESHERFGIIATRRLYDSDAGIYHLAVGSQSHDATLCDVLIIVNSAMQSQGFITNTVDSTQVFNSSTSGGHSSSLIRRATRKRRDLRPEIEIYLPENARTGLLARWVELRGDERVKLAPQIFPYLAVYENGSIELIKELNFETHPFVEVSVVVENWRTREESVQKIAVFVEDVDEPPKFLNHPIPFLAVVPDNAPIGYTVFKFTARDENGDGDSDVEYNMVNTGDDPKFNVDRRNGRVKLRRKIHSFERDSEFKVHVQACDLTPSNTSGHSYQANRNGGQEMKCSPMAVLEVKVGTRPPQFLEQSYYLVVSEDTPVEASVVHIRAKSFQNEPDSPIRFSLEESYNHGALQYFDIDDSSGLVRLLKSLDADSPEADTQFNMRVIAREGGLESSADLKIAVGDVNDNDPYFTQPLYTTAIPETYPPGNPILTVSAKDVDKGMNAQLVYSVDNGNFTVNKRGEIAARVRLDADQHQLGFFIYKFNVYARDRGEPTRTATAQVQIRTENVNDEAPIFQPTAQYTEYVAEDARAGTPILTVSARDPDRDQVRYSFDTPYGRRQEESMFAIDKDTGLIKLGPRVEDLAKEHMYQLTVVAVDDGSCCQDSSTAQGTHSSTAKVVIGVRDVNNNKPIFEDCESYKNRAVVPEGTHRNYSVIKVKATDDDSGTNGQIIYSLYYPESETRRPFTIDKRTGEVKTSPFYEFDREKKPYEDITVKATDRGERPLIGFCHFTVVVQDVNDNPPDFDRPEYEKTISRNEDPGLSVLVVYADDRDAPDNANIKYSLEVDDSAGPEHANDRDYFYILGDSGEIVLRSSIDPTKKDLRFLAKATDNGRPVAHNSTAKILLTVSESTEAFPEFEPSSKCPSNKTVAEDIPANSEIFVCCALSKSRTKSGINYVLRNGAKPSKNSKEEFRSFLEKRNGKDCAVIRSVKHLDYEKVRMYELTLTATDLNTRANIDKPLVVYLSDRNDNVPQFELDDFKGEVKEEQDPTPMRGEPILTVKAKDADTVDAYRRIRYRILDGPVSKYFVIDSTTGGIWANEKFDREQNDTFFIEVEASDSHRSSFAGATSPNKDVIKVPIFVKDINDNSPYFDSEVYYGRVKENAEVGSAIITLKAHDDDKEAHLTYSLASQGNEDSSFAIRATSGTLFVNEPLDYERKKEYDLIVFANDGVNRASVKVQVTVDNVNDNAPEFEQKEYALSFTEENGDNWPLPRKILTVQATDEDSAQGDIRYKLEGQGAGKFFTINNRNGEVYLQKPVNRDPPDGAETWTLIAQASDENGAGLTGYAYITITLRDINDNSPKFEDGPYEGFVEEEREPPSEGIYIMTMTATDNDDPKTDNAKLTYRIQRNKIMNGKEIFRIDENTGKIFAMMKLDREQSSQKQFEIEVKAMDHGQHARSGTGVATITVLDKNDNPPRFGESEYNARVKETARPSDPVLTVSAFDLDDEAEDNILIYEVVSDNTPASDMFYMTSDPDSSGSRVGVLRVKEPLDYESLGESEALQLTIRVSDGKRDPLHSDTAVVKVTITDEDDTPPQFVNPPRELEIGEDAQVGTIIHKFQVKDPDSANPEFFIDPTTDRRGNFEINKQTGELKVAKPLDREENARYNLTVGAVDEAGNEDAIKIFVSLADVNDNAPELVTRCSPLYENTPAGQEFCIITATDRDGPGNGPPFKFDTSVTLEELDPSERAFYQPDIGTKFSTTFDSSLDPVSGGLRVKSLATFDREAQKIYRIPIRMSDSGTPPQQKVRWLVVEIADKNDNKMSDGTKDVLVYKYQGALKKTFIGTVYVTDKDDNDTADKSFRAVNDGVNKYFDVDAESGSIYIASNPPKGPHTLKVEVFDRHFNNKAIGTVNVFVKDVEEEAFKNSGSFRVSGVAAQDLIKRAPGGKSILDSAAEKIRSYLTSEGISVSEVEIFSIMPINAEELGAAGTIRPIVDVRYSVTGSPYKQAVVLDGILNLHKSDFVTIFGPGAAIDQVGINACFEAFCPTGCTNTPIAEHSAQTINAKSTAFVGVFTKVQATCECPKVESPQACATDTCYNGGFCHNVPSQKDFFCECRDHPNLRGPRCEGSTRSFSGNGFAWFPPMTSCSSSHISLEFRADSTSRGGLLLYNGPFSSEPRNSGASAAQDLGGFFAVSLMADGRLKLTVNLGSGPVEGVLGETSLKDGVWHLVEIVRNYESIEMTLDHCQDAGTNQVGVPIFTKCRVRMETSGNGRFLIVTSPLQLGGLARKDSVQYPAWLEKEGFSGCIRNLNVDGKLYDLQRTDFEQNSETGCQQTSGVCGPVTENAACLHGECYSTAKFTPHKCICDPGWTGPECRDRAKWYRFDRQSFIDYSLRPEMLKDTTADIRLLFTTATKSGRMVHASSRDKQNVLSVAIEDFRPVFEHEFGNSLGSSSEPLKMQKELVPNTPYYLHAQKWPGYSTIRLDWRNVLEKGDDKQSSNSLLRLDTKSFFVGAMNGNPTDPDDFQGCLANVRWNGYDLPLEKDQSPASQIQITEIKNVQAYDGCVSTCASVSCSNGLVCAQFWKGAFCTCPTDLQSGEVQNGEVISCAVAEEQVFTVGITRNAIVAILVSILLLIVLVFFLVCWARRRRPIFEQFPTDFDIRQNIMDYREEGGGEEDQDSYDISRLRKPVLPMEGDSPVRRMVLPATNGELPQRRAPGEGDIGDFITDRLADADADPSAPPYDELRIWADEGDGMSPASSLSSLASSTDGNNQDWDEQLNSWGPRFQKLADMYSGGHE